MGNSGTGRTRIRRPAVQKSCAHRRGGREGGAKTLLLAGGDRINENILTQSGHSGGGTFGMGGFLLFQHLSGAATRAGRHLKKERSAGKDGESRN